MKAKDIKYATKVIVVDDDIIIPPGAIPVNKGEEITIYNLDGMYCNGINKNKERIYIAAWTEVEISKVNK